MDNIWDYIYKTIKDIEVKKIDYNLNILAIVDETPIVLESITDITIEKRGGKAF